MRKSNVNLSKVPKFSSYKEAFAYFSKYGKLDFKGREGQEMYCVHSYVMRDGRKFSVDICDDGRIAVIKH